MKVAQGLLEAAKHMSGKDETEKRGDENKVSRRWKVGLAGVAGAAVIGYLLLLYTPRPLFSFA